MKTIHQKYKHINENIFNIIDYFIESFPSIKNIKTIKSTFRLLSTMCPSLPCKKILEVCIPYHDRIIMCDVDYLIEHYQNIPYINSTIDEFDYVLTKEEITPFVYKLRDLYICCCIMKGCSSPSIHL